MGERLDSLALVESSEDCRPSSQLQIMSDPELDFWKLYEIANVCCFKVLSFEAIYYIAVAD